MPVEPLADVDVNVPGVMARLVAPADAQLSALLVPEFMLVGFAVKEVIVGIGAFSRRRARRTRAATQQSNTNG